MTLAEFIKNKRQDAAMTQTELALKLHVTNVSISHIENGDSIGPKILKKLSKYFKIETSVLRAMMLEGRKEKN